MNDTWDRLDRAMWAARARATLTVEWIGRGLGFDEGVQVVSQEDAELVGFISLETKLAICEASQIINELREAVLSERARAEPA